MTTFAQSEVAYWGVYIAAQQERFAKESLQLARSILKDTQASLEVRNDFVQHAGSAMLLWAEVLAEEEAGAGTATATRLGKRLRGTK